MTGFVLLLVFDSIKKMVPRHWLIQSAGFQGKSFGGYGSNWEFYVWHNVCMCNLHYDIDDLQ